MPTPVLPDITKVYVPKVIAVRAFQTPNDIAIPSRNRPGVVDQWRTGDYSVTVFSASIPGGAAMCMMQKEDFEMLFAEAGSV